MEPIGVAVIVGTTVVAGGALVVKGGTALVSAMRTYARNRTIKKRAKQAGQQMDQASRAYLKDVEKLLRR